jgi:putative ABC transport system permease protein
MSARTEPGLGPGTLLVRSMRAFRGGLIALAVVVVLATAGVVAWPAVTASLVSADAQHRLETAPVGDTSMTGTVPVSWMFGDPEQAVSTMWNAMPSALDQGKRRMQPALRRVATAGRFVGRSDGTGQSPSVTGIPALAVKTDPPRSSLGFSVEADGGLHSDAKLDAGRWPSGGYSAGTLEVVMSTAAARSLHWKVGTDRVLALKRDEVDASPLRGSLGEQPELKLRLTGTVSPRDASADFWRFDPARPKLGVGISSDPNSRTTLYHGVVWTSPDAWPHVATALGSPYMSVWFGLRDKAIDVTDLPGIAAGVTAFVATPLSINAGTASVDLRLSTQFTDLVQSILRRIGSVPTLLAIAAVGPLGAAIAVLFAGARLMALRRSRSLELMRARGGSELRVRGGMALEAAIVTVPAAIVGGAVAMTLTGAGASALLLIAACAVLPPLAVAATAQVEAKGRTHRRPVLSWTVELLVLLVAAAAAVLLVQRGAAPPAEPLSIDPLLAATPLLIVFAVCIVVLRVYPLLLSAIGRVTRALRGAVAQVGWATASRGRSGRLWPLFAMLTGVAVAVFAGNTLVTVLSGADQDALARVGANVTVSGSLTPAQLQRVRDVSGVERVAALRAVGYGTADSGENAATYLVDLHTVNAVQAQVPANRRLIPDTVPSTSGASSASAAVRAVIGGFSSSSHPTEFSFTDESGENEIRVPVRVVAHDSPNAAPFLSDQAWALLDRSAVPPGVRTQGHVAALLISTSDGVDVAAVAKRVNAVVGSDATVDSTAAAQERQRGGPLLPGIQNLMLAGAVLSVLMAVAALLLTLAMGRAARTRLLGVLRTLGFDRGQSAALVAWEVTPLTATAIVAGAATGIGLSALVLAALDLRPVTGALARPEFAVSWWMVGLVVAVFAVGAAIAVAVAVVHARRADTAQTLRAEEEA